MQQVEVEKETVQQVIQVYIQHHGLIMIYSF